jgi:hypothetical protein
MAALYGRCLEMEAMSGEIAARYAQLRVHLHDSLWVGKTRLSLQPAETSKGSGWTTLMEHSKGGPR